MEGLVGAVLAALVVGPVAFFLGGRRDRGNRMRNYRLEQLDQTLEYLLSLSSAALTVLELDRSEAPFERLAKARALPFRSPMAIPDTAQTPHFVDLLELSSTYSGAEAPKLIAAMTSEERQATHQHLAELRVLVQHLVMQERAKILAR
jgi:hypothetical protein